MVAHSPLAPDFRILVATPLVGGVLHDDVAHCLLDLSRHEIPKLVFEWERFKGAGLTVARNELARLCYVKNCHAILFNDSDNPAPPSNVFGLLRHGVDNIGGLYAHKNPDDSRHSWVANFLPGEVPNAQGCLKVKNCGAGFKLISRRALDLVALTFPDHVYTRPDHDGKPVKLFNYFGTAVVDGELLTEDFYFDHLAAKCGIDCHVDVGIRLDHIGLKRWKSDGADMPTPWLPASPAAV